MFTLRFFGPFAAQRKQLLVAEEFAPIPLHPAVERQLEALTCSDKAPALQLESPTSVFTHVLYGVKSLIIDTVAWTAVGALIVLGSVIITRQIVSESATLTTACLLAVAYLVLRLIQAGIDYGNNIRRLQVHRGIQACLYRLVNDKLLRIDPTCSQALNKGQLKTLVGSDVESVEDFISAALFQWTTALVSIAILAPALFIVSGWIGLLALLASIVLLPLAFIGARLVEHYQKKVQESQDSLTTIVGEWVKNIRLVRFLGWPRAIEREVVERMHKTLKLSAIRHAVILVVFAVSTCWVMVPLLVIFFASSLGSTPLGLIEVFSTYWILENLLHHIQHIPHSLTLYGSAVTGAQRLIELINAPDLERYILPIEGHNVEALGLVKRLVLKNVTVQYDETIALADISTYFDLDKRTAIVGAVGSGKSSLVELLVGERHPTNGEIIVEFENGSGPLWREDIYSCLRSNTAYSPQQPYLSNTLVKLNIDLSGESTLEDIEAAALASQLKPDILILPRLYDEEVGESGINLSGGQKQRVSLARAFISKRKFMVLDDPLSAVDTATETALMDSITSRSQGFVLVSHRLAELNRCDRVLVLEKGRLVEDGSPLILSKNPRSKYAAFLRAMEDHGN